MGRVKDYVIWHEGEYGYTPNDWTHFDEYCRQSGIKRIRKTFDAASLKNKKTTQGISLHSPSVELILEIQKGTMSLHDINWRTFEELVAELLDNEGWNVEVTRPSKDGGIDIYANKQDTWCGKILTIWQAKRLKKGNKVGLSTIRELADSRNEAKASKGIIVTTSFLTKGALERINKDEFLLGKVDHNDLIDWIFDYKNPTKCSTRLGDKTPPSR